MRAARILLPLLAALAAAACARQQQSYYITDPVTGQPVPVVHQYRGMHFGPSAYGQQRYAQQGYAAPQPQQSYDRGLFSSHDGFFTRYHGATAYAPQPYAQPPVAQQPIAQNGYVQQRAYGRYGYTMQYQPPQTAARAPSRANASASYGYGYGYAYAPAAQAYTLDSGDKLRVVVFGQQGITGTYMVDAGGNVSLPLIGAVPARGYTTHQLSSMIAERLKQGYVREPHVTVEIAAYRPFFILGEVTTPGQYPYVPNMTAENAIAIAGGFAPRADKRRVELTRNTTTQRFKGEVPLNYPLHPGDTVVVKERWF